MESLRVPEGLVLNPAPLENRQVQTTLSLPPEEVRVLGSGPDKPLAAA